MAYDTGNPELDATISGLISEASENGNADLISEIITTAVKLHRDGASRGDLKLVNTALKEIRYSMLVFSRHTEPKVTMYGSARLQDDDVNYQLAADFAKIMADRGWGVITGAGPGIMEAGNRGAGLDNSYGVNIRLPFESAANGYVDPDRTVNFKYFFTRKLGFVKESHAFTLFPGGFGTLDETFELLTLIQTGKSDLEPIVMMESEGTGYWQPLIDFSREVLIKKGLISPEDMDLFKLVHDPEEAAEHIFRFYANYQSQRYVNGRLVLRVNQAPGPELLAAMNSEYADIVSKGEIEVIEPTDAEARDADSLDAERVAFWFDRRHFGRLRGLINDLNNIVGLSGRVSPPAPFDDEKADRSW